MDSLPLTLIPQTPNAMPLLAKGLLAVKYFIVLQANGTSVQGRLVDKAANSRKNKYFEIRKCD